VLARAPASYARPEMFDVIRIERHELGPRLHLLGVRLHEYQAGLAILGYTSFSGSRLGVTTRALIGSWLVIKD
jgi:hypothetical protein